MFDFSTIKSPQDALVHIGEGDSQNIFIGIPNIEKRKWIYDSLLENESGLISFVQDLSTEIWVVTSTGADKYAIAERISTTLEMEGFKVTRKIVPRLQSLGDAKEVQSFITGA